jgi:hypothetical protein
LDAEASDTIEVVKAMIYFKEHIPIQLQDLYFKGIKLADSKEYRTVFTSHIERDQQLTKDASNTLRSSAL